MRTFHAAVVVACACVVSSIGASSARAAGGSCTTDAQCATGQVCRLSESQCVFEAVDVDTLVAAITAANADAARDTICIGPANAVFVGGEQCADPNQTVDPSCTHIAFNAANTTDATLGDLALPIIKAPLTIEGCEPDPSFSIVDDDASLRIFVVAVDALLDVQPDLVLKNLTIIDARPAPDAQGNRTGGAAIHVTSAPATTTGLLGTVEATSVVVTDTRNGGENGDAPVFLAGGDATFTSCTFTVFDGHDAGAIVYASAAGTLRLVSSTFSQLGGNALVGAVDVTTTTASIQVANTHFDQNVGAAVGALRSLGTTLVSNSTFTHNAANGDAAFGGAIAARNLTINAGTFDSNTAPGGGGAVAVLNAPATGPVLVASAQFTNNATAGTGGAFFGTGGPITLNGNAFSGNNAVVGGAGVYLKGLVDNNGATTPDALLTNNVFEGNLARLQVDIGGGVDATLDEKGTDTGIINIAAIGFGAAVVVDGAGLVDANHNCFIGNAATAVTSVNTGAMKAQQNWWGAPTGAFPGGDGDSIGSSIDAGAPLAAAPAACSASPHSSYPSIFVGVHVSTDGAQIATDYRLLDHDRPGVSLLNSPTGQLLPDTRRGLLGIDVVGTNRVVDAPTQTFTFSLDDCPDSNSCAYNLAPPTSIDLTITDDGTGETGEGEGEGAGGCEENLVVDPAAVVLPDNGKPSSASFSVTNASTCDVQLFAPFVQKGASLGFGVQPVPQAQLQLKPNAKLIVIATFTPPAASSGGDTGDTTGYSGSSAAPAGTIELETAGGSVKQVQLSLAPGCTCSSTGARSSTPIASLTLCAMGVALVMRRKRALRAP